MKMIRCVTIFMLIYFCQEREVFSQSPINDPTWQLNSTLSDEFNSSLKGIWEKLSNNSDHWGYELFETSQVQFGTEGSKQYLKLVGEVKNGSYVSYDKITRSGIYYSSGGLILREEVPGPGFGYYEIEARINPVPNVTTGFWPAFWTTKANKTPPPYYYEEVDIFEPGADQVLSGTHEVGNDYRIDESLQNGPSYKDKGTYYNLNMYNWHKYAVELAPNYVIFYVDDIPFFSTKERVPYRMPTNLYLDLQIQNLPSINAGLLGSFDINYFRYYKLDMTDCNGPIYTITSANSYDHKVHKDIVVNSGVSISSGSSLILHASNSFTINGEFTVDLGSEFGAIITACY